mmetsp:Transcript_19626/g.46859  ORF Transcript_19626/g.46859 Transcript_19626/m.46859 type:complete len:233 (-) Transcript_19626:910-1608(-)
MAESSSTSGSSRIFSSLSRSLLRSLSLLCSSFSRCIRDCCRCSSASVSLSCRAFSSTCFRSSELWSSASCLPSSRCLSRASSFFCALSATFCSTSFSCSSFLICSSFSASFFFTFSGSTGTFFWSTPVMFASLPRSSRFLSSSCRARSAALDRLPSSSLRISLYLCTLAFATRSSSFALRTRSPYCDSMASWSSFSFWYWRCSLCSAPRSFSSTEITCTFSATVFLRREISS